MSKSQYIDPYEEFDEKYFKPSGDVYKRVEFIDGIFLQPGIPIRNIKLDTSDVNKFFYVLITRLTILSNDDKVFTARSYHGYVAEQIAKELELGVAFFSTSDVVNKIEQATGLVLIAETNIQYNDATIIEEWSNWKVSEGAEKERFRKMIFNEVQIYKHVLNGLYQRLKPAKAEVIFNRKKKFIPTTSFRYKDLDLYTGTKKSEPLARLNKLYLMLKDKFIDKNTHIKTFEQAFSGEPLDKYTPIKWIGEDDTTFYYFIKRVYELHLNKTKERGIDWQLACTLFVKQDDKPWDNEKVKGMKAPKKRELIKALDLAIDCLK